MHSVSLAPDDASPLQAMKKVGQNFQRVRLELLGHGRAGGQGAARPGQSRLLRQTHRRAAGGSQKHVQNVSGFLGRSADRAGRAERRRQGGYVQIYLAGNQGEAGQRVGSSSPRPGGQNTSAPGVTVYVTGAAAMMYDQHHAGDKGVQKITAVTLIVIFVMLLLVYRSIVQVVLVLMMVFVQLAAARGIVAFLGFHNIIGLSTFAVNLLTTMAIAAATDYVIFIMGRYHEARLDGEDRETAFYTMYHGTAHVILGSGLTIAGATFCLHFTRLPYFQSLGIPLAIGMLIAVVAALTMAPAILTIGSHFGLFDPKRKMKTAGWRRVGTAVVRWPGPILVASIALALIGLLALPSYVNNYNDREYLPPGIPANEGFWGRGPALPAGPDEPRTADDRDRPRSAELGGHAGHRQGRQEHLPHPWCRPRPCDHPATGHSHRAHLDPVHHQHVRRHPAAEHVPCPAGPHEGHASRWATRCRPPSTTWNTCTR